MNYKTEFPDFELDVTLPDGFEDRSWHNDTSPCFFSKELGILIAIDYADQDKSEWRGEPEYYRFQVMRTDKDELATDDTLLSTNDWAEVEKLIAKRVAQFGAFQQSRQRHGIPADWGDEGSAVFSSVHTYIDYRVQARCIDESLHICERRDGTFYLCIANGEWSSDTLADLEWRLFQWVMDEGYDIGITTDTIAKAVDAKLRDTDQILDDVCLALQQVFGITDGGGAAYVLDHLDDTWSTMPRDERVWALREWLSFELTLMGVLERGESDAS